MIDTDKYEGHTPAPWSVEYPISPTSEPNRKLIEDAPLLLAEVKRLREELNHAKVTIDDWDKSGPCVTVYLEGCEYVGMLSLYKDENGKVIE
jgi:hypothetical protein